MHIPPQHEDPQTPISRGWSRRTGAVSYSKSIVVLECEPNVVEQSRSDGRMCQVCGRSGKSGTWDIHGERKESRESKMFDALRRAGRKRIEGSSLP
jgi:hypothetical protein